MYLLKRFSLQVLDFLQFDELLYLLFLFDCFLFLLWFIIFTWFDLLRNLDLLYFDPLDVGFIQVWQLDLSSWLRLSTFTSFGSLIFHGIWTVFIVSIRMFYFTPCMKIRHVRVERLLDQWLWFSTWRGWVWQQPVMCSFRTLFTFTLGSFVPKTSGDLKVIEHRCCAILHWSSGVDNRVNVARLNFFRMQVSADP